MYQPYCQIHEAPIIFIETSQEKLGSRLKCEKCEEIEKGLPLINISNFDSLCQEKKPKMQKEQESIMEQFRQFSDPLKKLLNNYQEEIYSIIRMIHKELEIIQDSIFQYYQPIISYDPQLKTTSKLEQTSDFIYSSRSKFNLKLQYFEVTKIIKNFIGLQLHYSSIMKKCFEQLQNDLANYELLQQLNVSPSKVCNAIALSPDINGQVISLALGNILQTYHYQNNQSFNLLQTFKDHEHYISCVIFSEDKQYLISGGTYDKRMNIYTESKNNYYNLIAQVIHQETINSIILTTKNEDLISASGNDLFILQKEDIDEILENTTKEQQNKKINLKQNLNKYQLTPSHDNTAYQLSYLFTTNLKQFLSCSFDKQVFVWQKQKNFWTMVNRIKMQNHIYRCCFISENDIVIQENSSRELSFYENVSKKNDFKKSKIKQFKFDDLNTDLTSSFPIVFIQELKLLIVKHNKIIVFLKQRTDGKFYKENQKEGEMGAISPNGKIFLKWNKKQSNLELYTLNSLISIKKEEFEKRYLSIQELKILQPIDQQKSLNKKDSQEINITNTNSEHNIKEGYNPFKNENLNANEDESTKYNQKEEKIIEEINNQEDDDDLSNLIQFKD